MLELTRKPTTGESTDLVLRVPAHLAESAIKTIKGVFALASHEVREVNEFGEEVYTPEEVFPDSHPGRILIGARTREDMTQAELARKLNIPRSNISEMERGKRPIGKQMAKRLADVLNTDYKVFL
jgi:DNA-binding XRE family transcriptional regulator